MAIISTLKDKLQRVIYPKTLTRAVYDETTNERLDVTLEELKDGSGEGKTWGDLKNG